MSEPADVMRAARERIDTFMSDLIDSDLFDDFAQAANELYKEQFAKKENPYGEPWAPRPGDDKRKSSPYFGKVMSVDRDSFELRVAASNANRSCVPFEPRGLGAWKPRFDEIVSNRARLAFTKVRP